MPMRYVWISIGFACALASCIPLDQTLPPMKQGVSRSVQSSPALRSLGEGGSSSATMSGTGALLLQEFFQSNPPDRGSMDAPVTMLVVTHPSCTYCRELHNELLPAVVDPYVAQGLIRVYVIILPIKKYPESALQAGMLYCAGGQGKRREMLDTLMTGTIKERAKALKDPTFPVDAKVLGACLDLPATVKDWQQGAALAEALGVHLVPTIVLDGQMHVGLPSKADMEGIVRSAMERQIP